MSVLDAYKASFDSLDRGGDTDAWRARRNDAMAQLMDGGLPTRKNEHWKYTPVRALGRNAVLPPKVQGTHTPTIAIGAPLTLTFVDGVLAGIPASLPEGVRIVTLADAARDEAMWSTWTTEAALIDNGFAALHTAFAAQGVGIEIAPDTDAGILHIAHVGGGGMTATTQVVRVGRHAKVHIVETIEGGNETLATRSLHANVDEGGHLHHTIIQALDSGAHLLGRGDVQLAKSAHFGGMNASYGGAITRDDLTIRLHGPGGHTDISALFAPRNGQTVDNHTTIDHIAPDCTSDQLYKGVLDGSGHGIFNGRIFVRQPAQRTAAEQMNRNLILSADARIDTKPQLEIFADDVRCTHGATIGQLDREELFYLMSRAIPRETARRLVIQGFADEVFERTDDEGIAALLSERFTAHMMT